MIYELPLLVESRKLKNPPFLARGRLGRARGEVLDPVSDSEPEAGLDGHGAQADETDEEDGVDQEENAVAHDLKPDRIGVNV